MKRKWLIYVSFFVLLTAGFLVATYWDYDFSKSKLAIINDKVQPFGFIDQRGDSVKQYITEGKVHVVEYFFTTCKSICPRMNANMRRIYDKFKDEPDFLILSHTCMPETDSVPVMKAYEQQMLNGRLYQKNDGSYRIDTAGSLAKPVTGNKNWYFLTGDKAQLYKLARESYKIDDNKPDSMQITRQFLHTQFFALLDKHRNVRGIYDGTITAEVEQLMLDIGELLKEKTTGAVFNNGFSNTPR